MVTEISISVRNLVEFLLRSGDLDNRAGAGGEDAMLEGSRMHRQIQKAAGDGYQAEVTLRIRWNYDKRLPGVTGDATDMLADAGHEDASARPFLDNVTVIVEGRADGLYYDQKKADGVWTIDEIKTTYRRLTHMRKPQPVHLAQAKCYAYIYAEQNDLPRINVRMTYCNLVDGSIRYFHSEYTIEELRAWFAALMEEYRKWAEYSFMWQLRRTASIRALTFPYPYRDGQQRLVSAVYRTIDHQRKLYLEAPTGTGKTISTLYPAVRAMGEGKSSRIFYLTAKTITRTAAEQAIQEMRQQGLLFKSVVLTAREKICVLEHPDCNPKSCPRAKGHYTRINKALFDLLTHEDAYTRENIERYAERYKVCPFEMSLDVALFADGIIGDYNYLFDPHAYLRRFFGESGDKRTDAIFLIDEAHNLVDRGRSMYSASITKEDLLLLRREVKGLYGGLESRLSACNRAMLQIRKDVLAAGEEGNVAGTDPCAAHAASTDPGTALMPYVRNALIPTGKGSSTTDGGVITARIPEIDSLRDSLNMLQATLGEILTRERILEINGRFRYETNYQEKRAIRDDLLQFYFNMNHFLLIAQGLDNRYILYTELGEKGHQVVHLYNADPSANLARCMARGRASILFSATLLPITYYKALLGGTKEDYEIYAQSVFDPARRRLLILQDVTSRYRNRNAAGYERIADCIHEITGQRHGNYMIFFPSYAFLHKVADIYEVKYLGRDPETLKDLPVPAWKRRSAHVQGAWESEAAGIVPARRRKATSDDGQMSIWDLAYGAGTLPAPVQDHSVPGSDVTLLRQRSNMDEAHREAFLRRFEVVSDEESLLGFCTLGGIFSEGIDLREDALIGAVVVGTGIPQVSPERDLLKEYFDERGENGYDYAYRFPGMNKVLQAAGRVIRTQKDVGIVALLDDRFMTPAYRSLFPAEWTDYVVTTTAEAGAIVSKFWDEWL